MLVQEEKKRHSIGMHIMFKYIVCVGSRELQRKTLKNYPCLNTSYVSVQVHIFDQNLLGLIGLNTSYVSVQELFLCFICFQIVMFKYIVCVGSSFFLPTSCPSFLGLNTSYVSVQAFVDLERAISKGV